MLINWEQVDRDIDSPTTWPCTVDVRVANHGECFLCGRKIRMKCKDGWLETASRPWLKAYLREREAARASRAG